MIAGAALAAALAAAAPAEGEPGRSCTARLEVAIDRDSFGGGLPEPGPGAAELDALRRAAGERFRRAADALCARGGIDPAAMKRFGRLLVQNGEGADATAVYTDERFGPHTLVFQYAFAAARLGLPDQADVEEGLRCWHRPGAGGCDDRLP
ncbi:MAG TPA: hypothetical protein VGW34_04650 [Allosphingosinicella sp.]|nr:hypothetical protein [Allosphingosinicella sp.]